MSKAILVKNSAIISEEKIFLLTDHEEVEEKSKSINENPTNPDQSNAIILFDTKFTESKITFSLNTKRNLPRPEKLNLFR